VIKRWCKRTGDRQREREREGGNGERERSLLREPGKRSPFVARILSIPPPTYIHPIFWHLFPRTTHSASRPAA